MTKDMELPSWGDTSGPSPGRQCSKSSMIALMVAMEEEEETANRRDHDNANLD
ncbi:hypothetical protein U1Q18_045979, partial [Sarracenia purpurea var. burkii]